MFRENDNINIEEINKYRQMTQEEREQLIAEKEKEILKSMKKA